MARKKSKDDIAYDMYDEEFEDLTPGEKAAVTRAFNKQTTTRARRRTPVATAIEGTFLCKIGRIGNGVTEHVMEPGKTVSDLIKQAHFTIDPKKEGVNAQSTGAVVRLTDEVKAGEVYIIAPGIDSAKTE